MDNPQQLIDYVVKLEAQLTAIPIYEPQKRMITNISIVVLKHLIAAMKGEHPPDPQDLPNALS